MWIAITAYLPVRNLRASTMSTFTHISLSLAEDLNRPASLEYFWYACVIRIIGICNPIFLNTSFSFAPTSSTAADCVLNQVQWWRWW